MEYLILQRFWDKVDIKTENECWNWKASTRGHSTHDYGRFYFRKTRIQSHRVAWIISFGEIPIGLKVCHKCDNPKCVNPNHLFLGTQEDNMKDCKKKGRTGQNLTCGTTRYNAKVNDQKVKIIRAMFDNGYTNKGLSKMFEIAPSTICDIVKRRTWRHIT